MRQTRTSKKSRVKYLKDVLKQANKAEKSKGTAVSTDGAINNIANITTSAQSVVTDTKLNDNSRSKSQLDE